MKVVEWGRSVGSAALKRVGRVTGRFQEGAGLATDVLESDDEYLVVFDAPGARASDVQVRYRRDEVHVRVDRFREYREGFEMVFPGRGLALDGRVRLPPDAVVDPERARATLNEDGTLYVYLPKADGVADAGTGAETAGEQVVDEATTEGGAGTTGTTPTTGGPPDADE